MDQDLERLLAGKCTERRYMPYTWRDVALYAVAVGAKADELMYVYEKNMKALPTFGTLPCWAAACIEPHLPRPAPAALLAQEVLGSTPAPLHLEHELIMHRSIQPIKGGFSFQDKITDVYDWREKGIVVKSRCDVYDEAGNLVCTNISSTLFREGGGFGGRPLPTSQVRIPERRPEYRVHDYISPVQNILYRLTGDTNLVHIDPDYAREQGFSGPFMHGLCSFGFACRMAVQRLFPGRPERVRRIRAQMRSVLHMDTPITLELWEAAVDQAYFRLIDENSGKAVLDRGILCWE